MLDNKAESLITFLVFLVINIKNSQRGVKIEKKQD